MRKFLFLLCLGIWGLGHFALGQQLTKPNGQKLSIPEALKASKEKEAAGDPKEASRYLNHVASVHWEAKKYDSAIYYFENSLKLNASVDNQHGMYGIYSNLAMIYSDMKDYPTSLEYFLKTLEGRKKGKDKVSIISTHINTAVVLNNLKQHTKAAEHLEEALRLATEMSDADQMKSCYGMLAETYDKAGDNTNSMKYYNLYRTFHEMVQREREIKYKESAREAELRSKLLEVENRNKELALQNKQLELQETQEELTEIDAENQELLSSLSKQELMVEYLKKEDELKEAKLHEQEERNQRAKITQYFLIALALLLIAFLGTLFSRYRERKQTNQQLEAQNLEISQQKEEIIVQRDSLNEAFLRLEEQNDKIHKSINYASRIQTAILPNWEQVQQKFPESFVFFRPRDTVSGDFYWFSGRHNDTVLVAADCTGHGVPGAFMSMVGNDLLNKIVNQEGLTEPGLILTQLDQDLRATLQQDERSAVADGMDCALVTLSPQRQSLLFAGAMNPLFYFKNEEFHEIKGDKKAIGGKKREKELTPFTTHKLPLNEGKITGFIFSDGYADQFGGPKGRKFMKRRFKQLLGEIHLQPTATQQQRLEHEFLAWKGKESQIDDVLVIGFQA